MKIRKGFVSNSSSSSFICDISGETHSGWDACLSEVGMTECEHGHVFMDEYLLKQPSECLTVEKITQDIKERINDYKAGIERTPSYDYYRERMVKFQDMLVVLNSTKESELQSVISHMVEELYEDIRYEAPEECCPICQFEEPSQSDLVSYFSKNFKPTKDEVFAEIKSLNRRRRKLYDHEYIAAVCKENDIDIYKLLPELKEKFGTYSEFRKASR